MGISFFKDNVDSLVGEVFPLWLVGDGDFINKEIEWSVSGTAALIRPYSCPAEGFYCGALVTLVAEGTARVVARCDEWELSATVSAHKFPQEADGQMHYFTADLHNHTTEIHDYAKMCGMVSDLRGDYVDYLRRASDIDLTVISDHASVIDDAEFFRGSVEVDKASDMHTVILPGCESEVNEVELDRYDATDCRLVGEIVDISVDDRVLAANGKVDLGKFHPITCNSFRHNYVPLAAHLDIFFKLFCLF